MSLSNMFASTTWGIPLVINNQVFHPIQQDVCQYEPRIEELFISGSWNGKCYKVGVSENCFWKFKNGENKVNIALLSNFFILFVYMDRYT